MAFDSNDVAARQAEDRRKASAARSKGVQETLDKQGDEQAVNNTEAMRRMDESRPTPTQRENDLARLGQHVMEKEDDGSGPDPTTLSPEDQRKLRERRAAEAAGGRAPYRTRDAAASGAGGASGASTGKPVA